MYQPRTDLVTAASLIAENATLRGLVERFTRILRELPAGDCPRDVQIFWKMVHDHDHQKRQQPGL